MGVNKSVLAKLASVVAASVILTGCTNVPDEPNPSSSSVSIDPTAVGPVDFEGLDPTLVAGLGLDGVENQDRREYTNWFVIPQAPDLTQAQATEAKIQTDRFYGATPTGSVPEDDSFGSFSITPSFVAISPEILGVRLSSFGAGESHRTLWYDLGANNLLAAKDLFRGQAGWQAIRGLASTAVKKTGQANANLPAELAEGQLQSLSFDTSESLVLEFDSGSVAPDEIGGFAVRLPAAEIKPLLSDAGRKALAAAVSPQRIPMPGSTVGPTTDQATPVVPQPDKTVDCAAAKCIALTFDDGPGPRTPELLKYLREQKVKATFYVLGSRAKMLPDAVREAYRDGNEIASHTWSHSRLTELSVNQVKKEIDDTAALVKSLIGRAPASTRPPYGATNDEINKLSAVPVVAWDVDTLDWKSKNSAAVIEAAVSQATSGSIVLMHDIHPTTVEAVPGLIEKLRAKGFTFVTVSQILASQDPQPGTLYTKGK